MSPRRRRFELSMQAYLCYCMLEGQERVDAMREYWTLARWRKRFRP